MALDNAKNFAKVQVSTGYNSAAVTVVLEANEGAKLPTVPFNVTWYNSTDYTDPTDDPNVEIVRVTDVTTDTLTVTRAQEGTTAKNHNTSLKTYKMIAGLTAKLINTDLTAEFATAAQGTLADNALPVSGGTMTGDIQLGETEIKLDALLSGDEKWSGITTSGILGATIIKGDLCYLNNDDGRWEKTDANLSDGYDKQLGICLVNGSDGSATTMLLFGKVRSAAFPAFTVGAPLYMSETAGDLTHTYPTTADSCIRLLGFALTAEDMMFNPSNEYLIHT